ncbi:MAG: chloride channel protein [Nitrospiraceae bacterium]|nr:MAG: chloride channel protein [Nitrospiraceae bacterium]
MKRKVLEGSVLIISIIKWLLLASCIGIIVGLSTSIFLKLLDLGIGIASEYTYYFLLLPVALFLSSFAVKYFAPEAEGHGTEKVIEAVHKRSGKINPLVVPIKLVATVITIALGGSAGKEGPCAQIGAGLSSTLSDILKFDDRDRKKLVICGISAGFATVFGTPIAGAIFGVEVLFVGGLLYEVLLPSFVAGIVGYQVSSALGITYFHQPLNFIPIFSSFFFIKVCLSGLFFGLCSFLFIEILKSVETLSDKINIWQPYKGITGGVVLIVLTFLVSPQYLGLGLDTIKYALEGGKIFILAFLFKMIFTAVTLNFGGSGGIVTPIFFIGAASGNLFGRLLGLDLSLFSAIGMVSLLAGAANTPISASIMAVELFGPAVAPYAAVACVISFLMTGHRSVYPSQVLEIVKSSSISVERGREMENIENVSLELRSKSIIGNIAKGLEKFKKR